MARSPDLGYRIKNLSAAGPSHPANGRFIKADGHFIKANARFIKANAILSS